MCLRDRNILGRGKTLIDIGINDFAYHSNTIDEVLAELERLQVIILGGDVYRLDDDELVLTYDSWCYNLLGNQSDFEQSRRKARDYISDYLDRNGEDYYFSFVLKDS